MRRICSLLLPLSALAGGYFLRMQQLHAAADTAPAFFKNIWGIGLWTLLGALVLLLLLLLLPLKSETDFQTSCRTAAGLPFQWAGTLLVCFAAANSAMLLWSEWRNPDFYVSAVTALACFFLLPAVMVRFRCSNKGTGPALLLPLVLTLYRLLRWYLSSSADPDIHVREMRLLFFASFTLFLITLTAFAFGDPCRRRLLLFAGLTVGFSGAAMYDTAVFSEALLIIGCTALSFGFYLSVLFARQARFPVYEFAQNDLYARNDLYALKKESEAPAEEAPLTDSPAEETPAEDDPFPVIFENGRKMPPPKAAPAKKSDDELDLSRVDRLLREIQ